MHLSIHSQSQKSLENFGNFQETLQLCIKILDLVSIHLIINYGLKSMLRSILRGRGDPYFALLRRGSIHHGEEDPDLSAAPKRQ